MRICLYASVCPSERCTNFCLKNWIDIRDVRGECGKRTSKFKYLTKIAWKCARRVHKFHVCSVFMSLFAWQVNKRSKNIRSTDRNRWKHHLPFSKSNAKPICGCFCHEKLSLYQSMCQLIAATRENCYHYYFIYLFVSLIETILIVCTQSGRRPIITIINYSCNWRTNLTDH